MRHLLLPALITLLVANAPVAAQSDEPILAPEASCCEQNRARLTAQPELGPYTVKKITLTSQQTPGFGGADIFIPEGSQSEPESLRGERQQFPSLTMIPGYILPRKTIEWLAPIVASHGFVVMVMDARTIFDYPSPRAAAMGKALSFLTDASPAKDVVDPDRLGIWGHSMGGGAALETASKLPNVKAAIAVNPWHETKSFPSITQPTLVITGSYDWRAPANAFGKPMFDSLENASEKEYKMLSAGHLGAITRDQRIAQLTLDWVKRYL